ncbi:Cytochrome b5 [Penicillium atrosanguineum]|uniref:Protein HGH1 homolog n=1 Tax=Penicillium atrosanguineum TaxID=1132637 RepID=A0A9W9TZZ0_9EURO|nr:Cytochrome b5 [Penicillium atrosanguineum]KAJ5296551.1 Cytochrome b5 [Penicillium atrosanguineum]KAJ5299314.1 Oligopeptide transporter OPT superfamily [Penicillium atrosanguineum]
MPTELEDLVEFLHHGNTQIRQIACENLVGFSTAQPDLFKRHQLLPVTDLKLLARDYSPIAKNALTILINLSSDEDILKFLVKDDQFIEVLLKKLMNIKDPNVDEVAMLLANLVKSDHLEKLHSLKRKAPESVSTSENAIDQLMDCFVKGADGSLNKHANFDYLSYVFADLSQSEKGRAYFTTRQEYDGVVPITKLTVFTEHESNIRRKGVASTIKNVAFDVASHPMLFDEDGVNLLPYLLLPITGPEEFPDEESMSMLPDLQLLPPDKKRDSDMTIITTHLETLLLLTTTREGREKMRAVQVYPIIRECHLNVEDDDVRESCDRLVQVLMRDEEGTKRAPKSPRIDSYCIIALSPTTITVDIPLQTRKLSCPPNPRGEWLPASDRVELPDSDVCDDGSRDSPDPVVNLPDHPSLAQQFWALMSRAPLIRSSPALGSSSYGAVRFPQDSDDDANLALQPKNTRQVSNGTTRTSYESCQGGPSSGGRSSRPKRSHSSNRRKSSELYTEGHNRRPSSATSDIGMGADSKYSFATGLAVPGNPVIQETPITSPYLTSDDEEDVLDIEDEVTKPADDDPPDNSPYAQVRATVPATDDISLSINTPRMWFLSLLFSLTGSAANLFFSLRYPSVAITPIIALVLVHPLGKFWDVLLKRTGDHLEVFENGTLHHRESLSGELETPKVPWMSRVRQWFAQGRWNEKEHACVYISSNVSFGFAFATDVIVEQHKFYQQEVPIMYQVLLIISTQVLGYAFAGLTRRFLVRPSAMIWPGTLMSTAMFTTMHKTTNKKANGWSISRYKFFIVVWGGAFLWYFVPGLLMPALSYFNVITWFAPKNVVVSNLFGVASGLGMFPLTFDWAQIAYIGSPLLTPWWAAANIVTGLVVVIWIIAPILYYKNVLFSSYMPILSAAVFDNTGHPYDVSRILTSEFLFDQKAYEEYSPVYLPITYVLSYGVQFAALTSLVTHTICWYGKDILHQTRKAFEEKREMPDLETYEPLRTENGSRPTRRSDDMSRVSSHDPTREMPLGVEDVHCRLMRRYKDAPLTWYLIVLVTMLAIATYTVEHYPVHLPWYGLFLALIITSVFFIPVGIIMAVTNQHSSLYLICQLLCGIVFPGRPVANMIFVTYSYISSAQGIKFSSDLKLGHYMKIPPRILFGVQMMATLVSSLTQIGVLNWMFAFIPGLCTPQAMNGFNCPIARVHFNGSILWGVVGPQRFFGPGGLYRPLVWAFLLGAIAPLGAWILGRRSKKNIWRMINFPILFGSLSWIPPATGLNFSIWAVVCFVFNYVIRRRKTAWWEKYAMTLSAALDSGLAFAVIVVFFACIYPGWVDGFRWWGTEIYKQGCDWIACPYKQLEPGQTFGG